MKELVMSIEKGNQDSDGMIKLRYCPSQLLSTVLGATQSKRGTAKKGEQSC